MKRQFETVEDFVADESFQNFCFDSDRDHPSKWTQYIAEHPEQSVLIEEARLLVQMLYAPLEKKQKTTIAPSKKSTIKGWMKWSAAILLLLVVTGIAINQWTAIVTPTAIQQEMMSIKGEETYTTYTLPDQSKVVLRKDAQISWMTPWGKQSKRELWVEGEAYFDVQHDPLIGQKEFTVHLNDGDINVLGTSFLVKPDEEETSIFLESGIITYESKGAVYSMRPGDQLQQTEDGIAIRHEVEVGEYLLWNNQKIAFTGQTVNEVVRQLSRSFDLTISIGNKKLMDKKISASIAENDPHLLLEAIAAIYDIKIIKRGDQIILK